MLEIVSIKNEMIGGENQQCVDARELWEKLESKRQFSNWITQRIESLHLVDGQDVTSLNNIVKREKGSSIRKEYILTLEVAKHISMMENTSKGREIRQYFIEVEKRARKLYQHETTITHPRTIAKTIVLNDIEVAKALGVPAHIGQIEAVKAAHKETGVDYSCLLLSAPAQNNIKDEEKMLEPTELGRLLGISAKAVNKRIAAIGYQNKVNKAWVATYKGKRWSVEHAWKKDSKSGYNLKWNVKHILSEIS